MPEDAPNTLSTTSKPMRLLWVVAQISREQNTISSPITSVRLRCLEIIKHIAAKDQSIDIRLSHNNSSIELLHTVEQFKPSIVIFGDIFETLAPTIHKMLENEIIIALDITRDIFNIEPVKTLYSSLLNTRIHWIVSSDYLQDKFQKTLSKPTYLVKDAIEGLPSQPTMPIKARLGKSESKPLRLVWVGPTEDLESLFSFLMGPQSLHTSLVIVTQQNKESRLMVQEFEDNNIHHHCQIHLTSWSLETQRQAIMQAHCTILPTCPKTNLHAKSAYQIVRSLWFGTPVIANPLPSFFELEHFCNLDTSISRGLENLLNTPWKTTAKTIADAQDYIQEHFSVQTISQNWLEIMSQLK